MRKAFIKVCKMTSIAVVEDDHCSHGIWNSGNP